MITQLENRQTIAANTEEPAARLFSSDGRLREIVRLLVDSVSPARIYLFGSRSNGSYRPDSDYDLALIYDGPLDKRELKIKARRCLPTDLSFDILVLTSDEFHRFKDVATTLPRELSERGVVVYG